MRLKQIAENDLYQKLITLRGEISQAAQDIYDAWHQEDAGGICDEIAQYISGILSENDINNTEGGHDGDDHAYIIAYDNSDCYIVDIPYDIYEIGGGYNWKKIPNVVFEPDDVVILKTHRPDWID